MEADPSCLTLLSPLPSNATDVESGITGAIAVQQWLETPEAREKIGGYQFHRKVVTHYFCKSCGVHCFAIGKPLGDRKGLMVAVNVNAIDDLDLSGEEWMVSAFYVDGKGDFKAGVGKVPFEGGRW